MKVHTVEKVDTAFFLPTKLNRKSKKETTRIKS
jgi:hypothetical protein